MRAVRAAAHGGPSSYETVAPYLLFSLNEQFICTGRTRRRGTGFTSRPRMAGTLRRTVRSSFPHRATARWGPKMRPAYRISMPPSQKGCGFTASSREPLNLGLQVFALRRWLGSSFPHRTTARWGPQLRAAKRGGPYKVVATAPLNAVGAAVPGGPSRSISGLSIIGGRVAREGDPYGIVKRNAPGSRLAGRPGVRPVRGVGALGEIKNMGKLSHKTWAAARRRPVRRIKIDFS